MQVTNTRNRYGAMAITFHWTISIIVICLIGVGLYMANIKTSPLKLDLIRYHKEFGILVLMLVSLRLGWRLANITPDYPDTMPSWQKIMAHGLHWTLYGFLFAMPLSGYIMSCAAGFVPSFFGLFTMPAIIEPNKELADLFFNIHKWLGYTLIILICGHAGAALEHHFVEKDNILRRMLGIARSQNS